MCGIAGFINTNTDAPAAIRNMTDAMAHRGPDGAGFWTEEGSGVTLGHRRLAVVDLTENGAQPMHSADERYVLVYNGEIYNACDIRQRLQESRPRPALRGTSDTEVILEAFGAFGIFETLAQMKGMFALALYDRRERTLYLMRDRAGEKPLYYGFVGGNFVFGSELCALERYPGFAAEERIDREALAEYMRYGFVPAPLSVYEGIRKLLPGTCLILKAPFREYRIETYWSMREAAQRGQECPFTGSFREACDMLEGLLTDAVEGQMISDVPIGAFLSGGIDSPLIVSLMQKLSKAPVRTFTIGFEDGKYNEAGFAKEIARYLGTDHTELYVSERELLDVVPKLGSIFSEPFADPSQIPTFLVSRLAKSRVTVSLSGDAGDELFGGYNTYPKIGRLYRRLCTVPYGVRRAAGRLLLTPPFGRTATGFRAGRSFQAADIAALHEAVCYHTSYWGERCVTGAHRHASLTGREEICCREPISEMQLKDMRTYHPDDILVKVDRAGMAVSLENRVPMLDRDVMEFAWRLPVEYKISTEGERLVTKRILRHILYRYVPKEMFDRPKMGFSVPLRRWLTEGAIHAWAAELIGASALVRDGYFDAESVGKLWKGFLRGKEDARTVWQILMAEEWYRRRAGDRQGVSEWQK